MEKGQTGAHEKIFQHFKDKDKDKDKDKEEDNMYFGHEQ